MSKYGWRNGADRLAQHRAATNLEFIKNAISAKCNKKRYVCMLYWIILKAEFLLSLNCGLSLLLTLTVVCMACFGASLILRSDCFELKLWDSYIQNLEYISGIYLFICFTTYIPWQEYKLLEARNLILFTLYFQCFEHGLTYRNYSIYMCLFIFSLPPTQHTHGLIVCHAISELLLILITAALNLFDHICIAHSAFEKGKNMC